MKKLILVFIISFGIFALVFSNKEIKEFSDIYTANSMYIQNNLTGATDIYNSINDNGLDENNQNILKYLKGNTIYKQGDYFDALNSYSKVESKNNKQLQFYKNNALGNTKYRLGEGGNDLDKLKYRQDALTNYLSAINQQITEDKKNTLYNYNLVKNKLDELKKKLEQEKKKRDKEKKKEQEKQNKTGTGTEDKKDSSTSSGQNTPSNISKQPWRNGGEFNGVGNQSIGKEDQKLTPEEKKELDNYSNSLKDFQKNNNQYLQRGGQKKPDTKQDIFDKMMNEFKSDPFFKDVIPQDNTDKDW